MRRTLLAVLCTGLAATACAGAADPGVAAGDDSPIGAWQLRTATPAIEVPDAARITLTVEEAEGELRAGGTAACNSYGGTLDASDGRWRLDELGWTEMGCDQPLMAAESAYLAALQQIESWSLADGTLTLTGEGTELILDLLAPIEPAALTGTTWTLDGLVSGSGPDGAVTSTPAGVDPAAFRLDEDGTFALFTGCRDFAGEWTTSGDQIVLPSWGQTDDSRGVGPDGELSCADAAEAQERTVIGVLEGAFTPDVAQRRLTIMRGDAGLTFRAVETDGEG